MKTMRVLFAIVFMLGVLSPFRSMAEAHEDIVDVAIADGRFTTLVAALEAADLVDTLKGDGPFTVFAPTDDAFDKLPAGTVEALLDDIPTLTNILLYHVVSGEVMAAQVLTLTSADTVQGESISIAVRDGSVFLNDDVEVIITDVEASNGVIHVIDAVLMPPAAEEMVEEEVEMVETAEVAEAQTELPTVGVAPDPMGLSLITLLPVGAAALGAAGYLIRRKLR